jgi:hypothetical protein
MILKEEDIFEYELKDFLNLTDGEEFPNFN